MTANDKSLLSMLPVVVMWINHGTDLTEQEIRTVARLHPAEFDFAKRTMIGDMHDFMERYRNSKMYKDLIQVVLSEKGWSWVERTIEKVKSMPALDQPATFKKKP